MSEERPLSMKFLLERIERLEDHIRQIELDSTRPTEVDSDIREKLVELEKRVYEQIEYPPQQTFPEWAEDILVASINALYNQRSQGAYNMAKALERKYFEGRNIQEIGDRLSLSADLYSATKENT